MTDETQTSPAGEASSTPKRTRRTTTKKQESAASTGENTPAPKTAKTAAKPAAERKTTRPRTQKTAATPEATPKDAQTVAKGTSITVNSSTAPEASDTVSNAAPKPRSRRSTSTKTPKASSAPTVSPAVAALEQEASPNQEIFAAKPAAQRAKAPAKRPERRPAKPKTPEQQLDDLAVNNTQLRAEPATDGAKNTDTTPPRASAARSGRASMSEAPASVQKTERHPIEAQPEAAAPAAQVHAEAHDALDAVPTSSPEDAAATPDGETPARKSRRGRRGGRGRSKNRARETANAADSSSENADTENPELSTESSEETPAPAQQSRQRNTPKAQARPPKAVPQTDDDDVEEVRGSDKVGHRKMFISVVPGEQVEVALVEEGAIHEYYLEMLHQAKTKGNIYKGVIHNIDTNLQAAFVNYGANKNGFLQIDEVHPEYYLTHHEAMKGKKFPPMQKVLKAGQEVLVQVVKEPSGSKGAFLTTWLSLAGRFLVLTPGQEQIGVSRKVENDEERARLREMMNGIDPGEGLGVIVRTVSAGTSKTTLKNDLQYLKRVWKDIRKRGTSEPTPSLIYQEPGLAERAVRDYLTDDVCEVWVDDAPEADALRETVALLFPRKGDLVRVHNDLRQTLWERFNIQRQLEQIYSREVTLPSGGRLVFDQTEALMAIDINSGKISGKGNFEAMALKTNVEAAECIARQLKLRDIGGQIVIDFIEMRDKNHIRDVEKTLRTCMKNDRARHDVGRMSSFGLLEIVRQRTASSALAITMEPCPACGGTGLRRNIEWQSLQVMREIARLARLCGAGPCQIELATELGLYLLNHKRDRLREMEKQYNVPIEIKIRP